MAGLGLLLSACSGEPSDLVAPIASSETTHLSPSSNPEPSLTPSPSPSNTPTPKPYAEFAKYSDVKGRFTFPYPADWTILTASESTVSILNYDPTNGFGWEQGQVKIEVGVFPASEKPALEGAKSTRVDGHEGDYQISRSSDPNFDGPQGLHLDAVVTFISGNTGYGIAVRSGNDPPKVDEDLFWKIISEFHFTA